MKNFNVLDRNQEIQQSYILEASAGTGKTFSIENLVVRLLIDEAFPCTLEQILVVTFTKAAMNDLKVRIRGNIAKALSTIKQSLKGETGSLAKAPDYLIALLEKDETTISYARRQLEYALIFFDQASIFTIHGFCNQMLREYTFEGDLSLGLSKLPENAPSAKIHGLIKDFFRTELTEELIGSAQLQRLLSDCRGFENLEKRLVAIVQQGSEISAAPLMKEYLSEFIAKMQQLKASQELLPDFIVEDFLIQAPTYKEICDVKKQPKKENVAKVRKFAALFEKDSWGCSDLNELIRNDLYLVHALKPQNRDKRKQAVDLHLLHYPNLASTLSDILEPLISDARNCEMIFSTVAHRCKAMIKKYFEKEELFSFDDLLLKMLQALQNDSFSLKVQKRFTAAIIDEFQDTDPLQWKIFSHLFLNQESEKRRLYLVGDPKQSIYGFRQADIYTYLKAGESLEEGSLASLDTNYRSHPDLVEGLNFLFSKAPRLMMLPKLQKSLPYRPVKSGNHENSEAHKQLSDGRGRLHFFGIEEKASSKEKMKLSQFEEQNFFPFIAQEAIHLHEDEGYRFNQCAILVGDRHQASRLTNYLKRFNIPHAALHSENLAESVAYASLNELLKAILFPKNSALLKTALGGPLIGWTHLEIKTIQMQESNFEVWENLLAKCMHLRKTWMDKGFAQFFQNLLASSWLISSEKTLIENLLTTEDGDLLYRDLQQIAELLMAQETTSGASPHRLLDWFSRPKNLQTADSDEIKQRSDPDKEGMRILTMHASKGLEFDIVFALGVIRRSSKKPSLQVPVAGSDSQDYLSRIEVVKSIEDPRYIEYCQELDAEKIRQFYVALTRAKDRLYVPFLFEDPIKKCSPGMASPMELYLAQIGEPHPSLENLYEHIPHPNPSIFLEWIKKSEKSITLSTTQTQPLRPYGLKEEIAPPLIFSKEAAIPKFLQHLHSFTALSQHFLSQNLASEKAKAPYHFDNPIKNAHTLPSGIETGNLLHKILEAIPFGLVNQNRSSFNTYIERFTMNSLFFEWHSVISEMIFNTLIAEFPIKTSAGERASFSLKQLKEDECYREHEFLYQTDPHLHSAFSHQPGYVKGVIDLIFYYGDKYYLLDWKSNWLGDENSYSSDKLLKAMNENDYFLQAKLYKEALQRYLSLCDPRPFEEIFGGIFYVFLRGLKANSDEGILAL